MLKAEDDYEERIFGDAGGEIISTTEMNRIFNYLCPKYQELILDLGTGTGRIARKTVRFGVNVVGIDINIPRVKRATMRKKSLKQQAQRYCLVISDGQYIPFRDSSFDSIFCIRVLKYFLNYQLGIQEMSRVLKLDGILILSVSNVFSVDSLLVRLGLLAYNNVFRFRNLEYIFIQKNLVINDYIGLHKIHPQIWRWAKNKHFLAFLKAAEFILQKVTPKQFLSREILIKLIKTDSHK